MFWSQKQAYCEAECSWHSRAMMVVGWGEDGSQGKLYFLAFPPPSSACWWCFWLDCPLRQLVVGQQLAIGEHWTRRIGSQAHHGRCTTTAPGLGNGLPYCFPGQQACDRRLYTSMNWDLHWESLFVLRSEDARPGCIQRLSAWPSASLSTDQRVTNCARNLNGWVPSLHIFCQRSQLQRLVINHILISPIYRHEELHCATAIFMGLGKLQRHSAAGFMFCTLLADPAFLFWCVITLICALNSLLISFQSHDSGINIVSWHDRLRVQPSVRHY